MARVDVVFSEVSAKPSSLGPVDVDTVTLFFALLAGLAAATAILILVSAVTNDRFGVIGTLRPVSVEFAAAVAVTATFGSLYLSEIVGYEPCRLCWVQRAFMYPAAGLLVTALMVGRRQGRSGSSPARTLVGAAGLLAVVGLPIAAFHRYEQAAGGIGEFCDQDNPCSLRWVEEFGVVTIPVMAGAGFAAIIALTAVSLTGRTPIDDTQQLKPKASTEQYS